MKVDLTQRINYKSRPYLCTIQFAFHKNIYDLSEWLGLFKLKSNFFPGRITSTLFEREENISNLSLSEKSRT